MQQVFSYNILVQDEGVNSYVTNTSVRLPRCRDSDEQSNTKLLHFRASLG